MRIAVAGGTGVVGRHVVSAQHRAGHDPVILACSTGVDLNTADVLEHAPQGARADLCRRVLRSQSSHRRVLLGGLPDKDGRAMRQGALPPAMPGRRGQVSFNEWLNSQALGETTLSGWPGMTGQVGRRRPVGLAGPPLRLVPDLTLVPAGIARTPSVRTGPQAAAATVAAWVVLYATWGLGSMWLSDERDRFYRRRGRTMPPLTPTRPPGRSDITTGFRLRHSRPHAHNVKRPGPTTAATA